MRITLTVVGAEGRRDVLVEGDENTTVAALAAALDGASARPANVVRLPHARAPYGLGRDRRARPSGAVKLWVDG
ncbi:MAG: hypothetical protein IRZ07_20210, partial [Microbispora sp.]|nr:hypothetical protein [Microbispora sp.]